MRNKKRKSLSGSAPPGSPGAGTGPRSLGRYDGERRPAAAGGPKPRGSLAARVAALRRLTGWRAWAVKLATAVIIPTFLLILAEGSLRLFGCGYPKTFCLRQDGTYVENDRFLWQFYSRKTNLRPNPFAVPAAKPMDGLRIVILGESAAAGTPEPGYNFGRILDRMLRQQFPGRHLEVVNAAMRGVNSHILLPAARDCCARLQPDVVIVYMGNNEVVGLYAPGPHSGRLTSFIHLLRALQWVRSTRLGQLMEKSLAGLSHEDAPVDKQDELFFQQHRVAADDPRRSAVYNNFHANLADLCRSARRSGATVLLATVPVNLKDCPPFGSLHRADIAEAALIRWQSAFDSGVEAEAAGDCAQAISRYHEAAALDDHFAELHFRLARCQFALGQFDEARREFALACDWDALQFRADSRVNDLVRQVERQCQDGGTRLVDAARVFAESAPEDRGIPGDRFFNDHVHPNFEGDYLLAKTLFPALCEALDARSRQTGQTFRLPPGQAAASLPVLSRDECAARLALTRLNESRISADMLQATSFPPFTSQLDHARRQAAAQQRLQQRFGSLTAQDLEAASAIYLAAIRQFPDDWQLSYNFAKLRFMARDYSGAIQQFESAQARLPHWISIRLGLSAALLSAGRADDALRILRELEALHPESEEVKAGIMAAKSRGKTL
jgi:tetratricopeptide (TPR) repeat protein